nr:hypothetical protein [Bacteroidota bacterium]
TAPNYKLDITGDLHTTTGAYFATSSGNVGVGTTDPGSYKLNVNGNTNVTGTLTATTFSGSGASLTSIPKGALANTGTLSFDWVDSEVANDLTINSTNKITSSVNGASYFRGGDDAELWDVNVANTLGVYGVQDSTIASIKLGSGGGTISGYSGNIGIGDASPASLFVVGDGDDFRINTTGDVGIGIAPSTSYDIQTVGNIYFQGATYLGTTATFFNTSGVLDMGNQGIIDINWAASDDGAGSGLDADLLDGNNSSVFTTHNEVTDLGTVAFTASTTTALFITELENKGAFDNYHSIMKASWSYAGNSDISDTGFGTFELAGCIVETWTDNSSDTTRGNIHVRVTRANTGWAARQILVYNDQGTSYSPGWRQIWTSGTDGSGSGLDADLLDGSSGATYLDNTDTQNLGTSGNTITLTNGGSVTAPYATNAGDADTLDTLNSTAWIRDATPGNWEIASNSLDDAYGSASLEIREYNNAGAQTGALTEAPHLSFHWGGRVASQIFLETDADISIRDNPGTGYETLRVRDLKIGATAIIDGSRNIVNGGNAYFAGSVGIQTAPTSTDLKIAGNAYAYTFEGAGSGGSSGFYKTNGFTTPAYQHGLCHSGSSGTYIYDCNGAPGDIAEFYKRGTNANMAEIVSIDLVTGLQVNQTTTAYEKGIIGIISTDPYQVFGETVPEELRVPLAITGRVPVKVTLENGIIKSGDRITSSHLPGIGMKATKAGTTVGIAIEGFNGNTQISPELQNIINDLENRIETLKKLNQDHLASQTDIDNPEARKRSTINTYNDIAEIQARIDYLQTPLPPDQGYIMVLLNISWYDLDVYLTDTDNLTIGGDSQTDFELTNNGELVNRIGAFSDAKIANLEVGSLSTQKLLLNGLDVDTKLTDLDTAI